MNEELIKRIAQRYGVKAASIGSEQKGYRNRSWALVAPNATYNLILFKAEPGILARMRRADMVSGFLHNRGMPVRYRIGKIAKLSDGGTTRYCGLYNYLPGSTITWEGYSMEHIKTLGAAMAQMHTHMAQRTDMLLPNVVDEYQAIHARMARYFTDSNVQDALLRKLNMRMYIPLNTPKLLHVCKKLPNQRPLHMDFVRGNVLFKDKTITGILDFEKTAWGHPLFDIARTLAFLLVDCKYKPDYKIRRYFLHSGYQKRGGVQIAQRHVHVNDERWDMLERLVDMFLTYDLYKFLRHNPYEYLPQNEHFIRTVHILAKRGIVTYNEKN